MPRGFAKAQSCYLRKDVPHPMATFAALFNFGQRGWVIILLGGNEALEVVSNHVKTTNTDC